MICYFHYFIIFIFSIFRLWDDPRHHWPQTDLFLTVSMTGTPTFCMTCIPQCYSLCIWRGGGESNRVCLCGVGWVHGPSLGLWVWASLHCGGAVGERSRYPPQEWGKIEGRCTWSCVCVWGGTGVGYGICMAFTLVAVMIIAVMYLSFNFFLNFFKLKFPID